MSLKCLFRHDYKNAKHGIVTEHYSNGTGKKWTKEVLVKIDKCNRCEKKIAYKTNGNYIHKVLDVIFAEYLLNLKG